MMLALWGNRRRMSGILVGMTTAGLAAVLISLQESALLIGVGMFITGISFVFIMGLSRVIWQMKVAPDVLGRIFSLQLAVGVGAQSIGALVAGALADRIFEPLLMSDGALGNSLGALIGTGEGRGMAFMFMLMGVIQLVIAVVSLLMPSVRSLEDRLPDAESTDSSVPIVPEPAHN
jgi:tellurite resistance protein TehA-like permease